ncbi:HEAT repeat-containing protein 1-like [Haliotis rufescens]|uniref:HEAT repeat-containing protein 1-like n=1 Tax=Haliotis rufescens TaxID=6454 RepID=UPI00201F9101|nr:HEAT repeat-containing protein 1-like [Haliotis rufescens]
MATSLARQLQQLAVPHTQAILGEDKRKVSLLFDPKDAATFDKETFYALGVNGIEELEGIDPSFLDFHESLFSEGSLTFERSVQSKEVNKKLNTVISKFLLKLSPFFLLKAAQKSVEWLIQRYHIHFYNVDDLMMCILPYHDTKIFVRAVQLLDLNNKDVRHWSWLQSIQKPGVHLARSTLISHCWKNTAFLSFLCDMVPKFVKANEDAEDTNSPQFLKTVFSFYAMTVISVLDVYKVNERLLSVLIEPIGRGLQSRIRAYQAASYMIMAELFHKAKVKKDLSETFIHLVCKFINPQMATEAVTCILIIFQTQDVTKLHKKNFKYLSRQPTLASVIKKLSETYNVQPLLQPLLGNLVPAAFKESALNIISSDSSEDEGGPRPQLMSLLQDLLTNVALQENTAIGVAKNVLRNFISNLLRDQDHQESHHTTVRGIVRQLEAKYPNALDIATDDVMLSTSCQEEKEAITSFLNLSAMTTQHQILPDNSTSLVLCLNHRQASVRQSAVTYMLEHMGKLEDTDFISESVLARLRDDNPEIVKMILQYEKLLDLVDDKAELQSCLLQLLQTYSTPPSSPMCPYILKWVCEEKAVSEDVALVAVVTHLFLLSGHMSQVDLVKQVFESSLAKRNKLLKALKKDWLPSFLKVVGSGRSVDSFVGMNEMLTKCLGQAMLGCHGSDSVKQFRALYDLKDSSPRLGAFTCLVMTAMCESMTTTDDDKLKIQLGLELLHIVQKVTLDKKLMSTKHTISSSGKISLKSVLQSCVVNFKKNGKIPPEVMVHLLRQLIRSMTVPEELLKTDFWCFHGDGRKVDDWLKTVVQLFNLLLDLVDEHATRAHGKSLVAALMKTVFPDKLQLLKLFCLLWTQHANPHRAELDLSEPLQARALCLGFMQLQAIEEKTAVQVLDRPGPVLCSLLVVFSSPHDRLRELALHCLGTLYKQCGTNTALYKSLLETVLLSQEELCSDPTYMAQVFVNMIEKTVAKEKMSSPKQRRRRSRSHSFVSGAVENLLEVLVTKTTPLWIVRPLLGIFHSVNNVENMTQLLPLLDRLLQVPEDKFGGLELDCVELLLGRYTSETIACVQDASLPLNVLVKAIESPLNPVQSGRSVAEMAIDQISREVYDGLPTRSVQQAILSSLFTAWLNTANINVSNSVRKTVKKTLHLQAEHIISELKPVLQISTARKVREAKRQRKLPEEESSTLAVFDRPEWQRVVIILEAVQDKKKLDNRAQLIPVCFQVLAKALDLEDHNSAEYIKQLLLTTIYNLCNRFNTDQDGGSIPEEHFSMELIVQCIRTSDNPQTHHQALLVLTVSAKICPEHLLHNIMTVFTFMGANILRQDDSYSFHVISKILENVIPALISTCEGKSSPRKSSLTSKPEEVITMVMRVFVDAYPYIPQHRKLMLYTKLVRIVGQKQYLWRCLLLFIEHVVTRERSARPDDSHLVLEEKMSGPIAPAELEFILSLSTSFSPATQLMAARDAIVYISQLPDDKDDTVIKAKSVPQSLGSLKKEDSEIFSVPFHTAKQLRHFKYAGVHLFVALLSHQQFVSQVAAKEGKKSLQKNFESLLETLLQYISQISRTVDKHQNKPTSRFWKAYLHKAYDMIDKIACLLRDHVFVEVISGLLKHGLPTVQRKAMELLNSRLQQVKDVVDKEQEKIMMGLVDELSAIVKQTTLDSDDLEETGVNGQTALYSLKVLCRLLGTKHPDRFIKVLQLTCKVLTKRKDSPNVLACALLCVGEISADLKVHVIPHLPTFMPKLLKILGRTEELAGNELLLQSCVTVVNKVVENLPHFLSPYILDITKHYCLLSGGESPQKPQVQQRLLAIRHAMATVLPTRVILPTVVSCYEYLVEEHQECVECLMSLLEAHIKEMNREDLASFHNEILAFFFICLDFRSNYPKESLSRINQIEDSVINTVICMVMKMSEATFRPMLFKVFDWATRQDDTKMRVLVFYRLADRLAEKLKSLFTLFAGYIVKHAAEVLDQNNTSKGDGRYFGKGKRSRKMSSQLLSCVLDTLYKCFLHDSDGFVTVERFDTLMQPIIDQIENTQGDEEKYKSRVSQNLVPCIGQFAVAARDDSLWKSMNYQILLKTRNPSPQVKFASLDVIEEFHKKLLDDFLPLLPETIPFLAELMEDENEEVEKRCQTVIADMERTLGEPLQKYF